MRFYIENLETGRYGPEFISARTIKGAYQKASFMISIEDCRGIRAQAENGSGFCNTVYDGESRMWDKRGRVFWRS